jgi:hypothetical protein
MKARINTKLTTKCLREEALEYKKLASTMLHNQIGSDEILY